MSKELICSIKKALQDAPELITSDDQTDYGLYYETDEPRTFDGKLDNRGDIVLSGCTSPDTRAAVVFYTQAFVLLREAATEIERLQSENTYLRSLLPDSDRAKKVIHTAQIRAENQALHDKLVDEKRAKG